MMTKKDFLNLADALRYVVAGDAWEPKNLSHWDAATVVNALCRFMRESNPKFQEWKWRQYLSGRLDGPRYKSR